jgi:hypothetical protein
MERIKREMEQAQQDLQRERMEKQSLQKEMQEEIERLKALLAQSKQ